MIHHRILRILGGLALFNSPSLVAARADAQPFDRESNFNGDWRFLRGDIAQGEALDVDDSGWRRLDLPHDYSIEDLAPATDIERMGPFSRDSAGGDATGHTVGGAAWYRKWFTLHPGKPDERVSVVFDGVYMNSEVWINGVLLGSHPNGYTSFAFDLTPHLRAAGQPNLLAVKIRNEGANSRWYSGSGIYRDVTLLRTHDRFVAHWGNHITTPRITADEARVRVETRVRNESDQASPLQVAIRVIAPDGTIAATAEQTVAIARNSEHAVISELTVRSPSLWSVETPTLYRLEVQVLDGSVAVDHVEESFGIRSIAFSPDKGFQLNGTTVLLRGACLHHDNGLLGAAAFGTAEERKVRLMKQRGFNAIRTAHNPPSTAFLKACDRLGMLVINESFDQWQRPKKPQDYHQFFDTLWERDIEAMLRRDRNHPSIIMWSFGNEINERADPTGLEIARRLIAKIRDLDPTRPATQAICKFWEFADREWTETAPAFALLDTHGYNYEWQRYEADHADFPERIIYGSESFGKDAFDTWKLVEQHSYVIGDFVWTGMDYLGEAGIGQSVYRDTDTSEWLGLRPWPWFNANCGDIDLLGNPKPQGLYRDLVWGNSPLEILVHEPIPAGLHEHVSPWGWPREFAHWNWTGYEGSPLAVTVYSGCDQVRLELNGRKVGMMPLTDADKLTARFKVPYEAGELTAVGLNNGTEVARHTLRTAGPPRRLILAAEQESVRAASSELVYINLRVIDEEERLVPDASIEVALRIEGSVTLQAAGNSDPQDMRSFQSRSVRTFQGRAQVILRSNAGVKRMVVLAETDGLRGARCEVEVR